MKLKLFFLFFIFSILVFSIFLAGCNSGQIRLNKAEGQYTEEFFDSAKGQVQIGILPADELQNISQDLNITAEE